MYRKKNWSCILYDILLFTTFVHFVKSTGIYLFFMALNSRLYVLIDVSTLSNRVGNNSIYKQQLCFCLFCILKRYYRHNVWRQSMNLYFLDIFQPIESAYA